MHLLAPRGLATLFLLLAGSPQHVPWELAPPAPVATGRTRELAGWEKLDCARCHLDIAREWAVSQHALAWQDEHYQEDLADTRRPESCHGCHIPAPLHAQELAQKPKARPLEDAHAGIRCESCHEAPDSTPEKPVVLGPFGAATDAHGSRRDESFLSEGKSALCITCHATNVGPVIGIAKDFVTAERAEKDESCVGCHMQPVERRIANLPGGGEAELPVRQGRSHALQTPRDPAFLRRALALSVARRAGEVVLTVENRCGHRIPGTVERELALAAELLDEKGEVVARAEHVISSREQLPIGASVELVLAGDGKLVRVRGTHSARGIETPVEFLAESLEIPK